MIDIDLWNRRRKELKLSLYDIAEATQIGISTIKDIFRGKRPTPRIDTVEAIEKVLGITRELQQPSNDTPKKERQPSEEVAALKAHVRKMGITYPELAEQSGIPLQTIQKIFCGLTQHPRIDTMQALQQACDYEPPKPPLKKEVFESEKHPKTKELDLEISEIKAYIRANGITYAKLSEMTGLSVSTITKIFGGFAKYPRADTLRLITNALGLTKQPSPKTGQISTSSLTSGISLSEKETRLLQAFSALIPRLQDRVIDVAEIFADMLVQ